MNYNRKGWRCAECGILFVGGKSKRQHKLSSGHTQFKKGKLFNGKKPCTHKPYISFHRGDKVIMCWKCGTLWEQTKQLSEYRTG